MLNHQALARTIHQINADALLQLLPHVDQCDLASIRHEFILHLPANASYWSWHTAWNDWTRATPRHAGSIRYRQARCADCRGRRWSPRTCSICTLCQGTGRGTSVTQVALYATVPEPTP